MRVSIVFSQGMYRKVPEANLVEGTHERAECDHVGHSAGPAKADLDSQ